MGLQVVWAKCAVTHPDTDEETILVKGERVPEWVSDFTRHVLSTTGAARFVEDDVTEPVASEPVRLPEHPPLTSEMARAERGTLAGDAAQRLADQGGRGERKGDGDGDKATVGGAGPSAVRPATNAAKAEWVEYAVRNGADRAAAEAATKDDLMSTKHDQYATRFAAKD